jgi:hypothetical protein|nr:MAG TPA_asm: hypothetical protein [Bacteriophage sp.]
MIERNNEKINTLRKGIKRLTNELDEQWKELEHFSGDLYEIKLAEYMTKLETIKTLGGFYFRYDNGKHTVSIMGFDG